MANTIKREPRNNNSELNLACIVLAAGNSSRLGQPKQLVKFKGQPLIARATNLAASIFDHTILVVGGYHQEINKEIEPLSSFSSITYCYNPRWKTGMGTSIAAGVSAISDVAISNVALSDNTSADSTLADSTLADNIDGVLILLCDQYQLTKQDLLLLCEQWYKENNEGSQEKIVVSHYYEKRLDKVMGGAPAIFPKCYFGQLSLLTTRGARDLIKQNSNNVVSVDLPNAGFDLDTQSDLTTLRQIEASHKTTYQ